MVIVEAYIKAQAVRLSVRVQHCQQKLQKLRTSVIHQIKDNLKTSKYSKNQTNTPTKSASIFGKKRIRKNNFKAIFVENSILFLIRCQILN